MPESLALRVMRQLGEEAIRLLRDMGLLDRRLRVLTQEGYLLIPLLRKPLEEELAELRKRLGDFEVDRGWFVSRAARPRNLMEALESRLPPYLLAAVPKSLDVVGDIAILELVEELKPYGELIGQAVLAINKNIRLVLAKAGPIRDRHRTRDYEVLAGSGALETTYREHGCLYKLDVSSTYVSPRMSYERKRVASQVKPGEVVVDMFAGVGLFSILIAKTQPLAKVYAIDINPTAHRYLVENLAINRVAQSVEAILGDARETVQKSLKGLADRVIMDLPGESKNFVDVACAAIKDEGGVIHYYSFQRVEDGIEGAENELRDRVEKAGRRVLELGAAREVKGVAPYELEVVLDAVIK